MSIVPGSRRKRVSLASAGREDPEHPEGSDRVSLPEAGPGAISDLEGPSAWRGRRGPGPEGPTSSAVAEAVVVAARGSPKTTRRGKGRKDRMTMVHVEHILCPKRNPQSLSAVVFRSTRDRNCKREQLCPRAFPTRFDST